MEDPYDSARERQLLRMFTKDMTRFRVLTREEETKLMSCATNDRPASMNRLIEANLRLALAMVFRHWSPGSSLMDMVSEACLGLVIAARTFDPSRGVRFTTYAGKAMERRVVASMLADRRRPHEDSLDCPAYRPGNDSREADTTLKDLLVSEESSPEEKAQMETDLNNYLGLLSERERELILLRFWKDKDLGQVGDLFNVGRQWAAQIERRALLKLRFAMQGMEVPWRKERKRK